MTNSLSSNRSEKYNIAAFSQVSGGLSWDLNRPMSSEWCMPMNLISMQARIIHLIKPFIQKALQMSAWDVDYNSFITSS